MSDLESRADDYERRVSAAGSTDNIVGGLVAGARRSRRNQRVLAVSLIFDLVLSVALGVVSIKAIQNGEEIDANAQAFQNGQLQDAIDRCEAGIVAVGQFNGLMRGLRQVVYDAIADDTDPDPETNAVRRHYIEIYTDAIFAVPDCSKLPAPSK